MDPNVKCLGKAGRPLGWGDAATGLAAGGWGCLLLFARSPRLRLIVSLANSAMLELGSAAIASATKSKPVTASRCWAFISLSSAVSGLLVGASIRRIAQGLYSRVSVIGSFQLLAMTVAVPGWFVPATISCWKKACAERCRSVVAQEPAECLKEVADDSVEDLFGPMAECLRFVCLPEVLRMEPRSASEKKESCTQFFKARRTLKSEQYKLQALVDSGLLSLPRYALLQTFLFELSTLASLAVDRDGLWYSRVKTADEPQEKFDQEALRTALVDSNVKWDQLKKKLSCESDQELFDYFKRRGIQSDDDYWKLRARVDLDEGISAFAEQVQKLPLAKEAVSSQVEQLETGPSAVVGAKLAFDLACGLCVMSWSPRLAAAGLAAGFIVRASKKPPFVPQAAYSALRYVAVSKSSVVEEARSFSRNSFRGQCSEVAMTAGTVCFLHSWPRAGGIYYGLWLGGQLRQAVGRLS